MKRIPNFDLLRLALALEVVYIHLCARFHLAFEVPLDPVPAFVCLSGLLIPQSFETSRGWRHFAWKRLLRVYPAFLASFVLVAILAGPKVLWPTFLSYATMGLLVAGTWNGPLWSLLLEELLYGAHVVLRLRKLWRVEVVLVAFAGVLLATMAYGEQNAWAANILRASSAFLAGNLAYFWRDRWEGRSGWWFLGIAVLIRLRILGLEGQVILHPLMCVSAVMAARCLPQMKRRIEDYSYGIYIYHQPVINALVSIGSMAWVAAPLVTICLAAVSWRYLERIALRAKDALPSGWRRTKLASTRA